MFAQADTDRRVAGKWSYRATGSAAHRWVVLGRGSERSRVAADVHLQNLLRCLSTGLVTMDTTWNFTGTRVLIAGGSRGIGRGIAHAFARAGAAVSICARGAAALEETRLELVNLGAAQAHAAVCDLSQLAPIEAWVAAAAEALGGVDVLVNNASGFGQGDTEEGWALSFAVDVQSVVRASRCALPWLTASTAPAVINMASLWALRPTVFASAYGAAKAAVINYTASQAAMWGRQGIRVNCVAPGPVKTKLSMAVHSPEIISAYHDAIPLNRYGSEAEIARVIVFLASEEASYLTGQVVAVDGGFEATGVGLPALRTQDI